MIDNCQLLKSPLNIARLESAVIAGLPYGEINKLTRNQNRRHCGLDPQSPWISGGCRIKSGMTFG